MKDIKLPSFFSNQKRQVLLFLVVVCSFFFTLAYSSLDGLAATTDEKFHFTRGIMLIKTGDLRLNQHHPYLFNAIPAIPGAFNDDLVLPSLSSDLWQNAKKDSISFKLQDLNGGVRGFSEDILFNSRVLMIVITVSFIITFFYLTKDMVGTFGAVIATIFLSTSPTLLAHGRLVTTDVPAALTIFIMSYTFYRYLKQDDNRFKSFIIFVLTYFIALLTKYTSTTLVVVIFPIMLLDFWVRSNGKKIDVKQRVKTSLSTFIKHAAVMVGLLFFLLVAAYKFEFKTIKEVQYGNEGKIETMYIDIGRIRDAGYGKLADNLTYFYEHVPVPFPQYIHGFYENVFKHNIFGHRAFLLGERSDGGWWYYFPVAFVLKEQLSTVILSAFSTLLLLWGAVKNRRMFKDFKYEYLPVILIPLLLVTLSIKSSLNLGVRHLLPVLPFVYLMVGYVLSILYKRYAKAIVVVVSLVVVLNVYSLVANFPYYIPYQNEVIQPAVDRHYYLRDSNLDWRQNAIRVEDVYNSSDSIHMSIEDTKPGEQLVISVGSLMGPSDRMSEKNVWLFAEYAKGEIVHVDEWIGYSHLLLTLDENPYYQEQESTD